MRNVLNAVIAAAILAGAAAPASADPIVVDGVTADQVRTTVDIRGLDAAQTDRRIALAARKVCGEAENRSIDAFARVTACRSAALANAREQVASIAGATSVAVAAIY